MSQNFQLLEYMNTGIRSIISDALKASLKIQENPLSF